ncbi:MAG: hypothetical protein Q7S09_02330 [bacterium]|nr:hypothetical protein [bacterium]
MKRLLPALFVVFVFVALSPTAFSQDQKPDGQSVAGDAQQVDQEALGKFGEVVMAKLDGIAWPEPPVYSYTADTTEGENTLRLLGVWVTKNGDIRKKVLASVRRSDITAQNWAALAKEFSDKVDAFVREMIEAESRGELLPRDAVTPLTSEEQAAAKTLKLVLEKLPEYSDPELVKLNPNFVGVGYGLRLFDGKRVVVVFVGIKDAGGLDQFYATGRISLGGSPSEAEMETRVRAAFADVVRFLRNSR